LCAVLATLIATSCIGDLSEPNPVQGLLALAPAYPSSSAGIVDIDRVRVVLTRVEDDEVVIDSIIQVAAGADSLDLVLTVDLSSDNEQFLLTLTLITPAGDTAFTAGPLAVTPETSGGQTEPTAVPVDLEYVGPGANAESVQITAEGLGVPLGETLEITAEALDGAGAVIPGTPIAWRSLNPQRAQVPDARVGRVVGGPERGEARIVAELLTGQADTVAVAVGAEASQLLVVSGNDQAALVGTRLDFPIVLQVLGEDQLGVPDVLVYFSTLDGGSFNPDSAFTDSEGFVSTFWSLGPGLGAQTGIATAAGLQITLNATGEAAPTAGRDVVVFNDINIFDESALVHPANHLLVRNLVSFDTPGPRNDGTVVIWDVGRNSPCGASCGAGNMATMRSIISDSVGFTIVDDNSVSGSITSIASDVKVIFLWMPAEPFTSTEVNVLKQFSAEGGRIVFVGEHDGFYPPATIEATQNQFLIDMGAQMTNTGGQIDCGRVILPETSLRQEHQIMEGLTSVQIGCASVIDPGPQDFALFFDTSNTSLLAGVAKVDNVTPLAQPSPDSDYRAPIESPVRSESNSNRTSELERLNSERRNGGIESNPGRQPGVSSY
jgi:hypothetical protein